MSADNLTAKSRAFYERTRSKMAASLLLIGMGLMALGWCSAFGGQSDSARHERTNASGDAEKALQSLVGGFGKNLIIYTINSALSPSYFDRTLQMCK